MIRPLPRRMLLAVTAFALAATASCSGSGDSPTFQPGVPASAAPSAGASTGSSAAPAGSWSDAAGVGKPYGTKVNGLLTFRGNPTRTFYGTGPIPRTKPTQLWKFPKSGSLCSLSTDEHGEREWCGSGWTGQPSVFERDGKTWVVFGAYDAKIHFLDASTGNRILPDFTTGDIIKGSVTIDPDGYPLVYSGSRDNYYRIIAIDRGKPTELWKLSANAVSPTMWNNDWDGAGIIIDDYLFEGGENSQFHIVKLNRGYGPDGKVTVKPKLVFNAPSWDGQLLKDIGDRMVSVENSVAVFGNTVYFANSGGLVQGWDISGLKEGRKPTRTFRFWTGDDTDASIAIDETGALYVGSEYERGTARAKQVGQMMKLDPTKPDPLVWGVKDRQTKPKSGIWGSPALYKDIAIFDTHHGDVFGIDKATGAVRWKFHLTAPTWQSPIVVDGVLLIGDGGGVMHAFDLADTTVAPKQLWQLSVGGNIESTPAVWNGVLYFGTRSGAVHAIGLR
ncbi:outer membrane protein assembly factor BamB [Allocatelliglobosispora scoriae]|uniref:Outer membrane protein assembly factor BamB n=1 Tax=Allocatelliglobosispora scoriae TaxID=643052 RepID=A0A841BZA5_9ACTN|nr:PQQ-binding-like beta-propeller repeat protein [Allocatelliglobosispora scoriae]MBB5872132.1 outer membrane protein assembly factor BamB [Allocatelliglobosispora scoriae]